MGYYDYSNYFIQLINRQDVIINNLQLLIFMFACFFIYFLLSRMLKGRW